MSISTLAARNGLNGQTLRKQYKEVISGYRLWDQLAHADEYILFPENFGADMSLDETCLSNGDVYTILPQQGSAWRQRRPGGDDSWSGKRHSVGNTAKNPFGTAS